MLAAKWQQICLGLSVLKSGANPFQWRNICFVTSQVTGNSTPPSTAYSDKQQKWHQYPTNVLEITHIGV